MNIKNKIKNCIKNIFIFPLLIFSLITLTGCDKSINTLSDLNGKKIGYKEGVYFVDVIDEQIKNATKVEYVSTLELEKALMNGDIDAFVEDEPIIKYLASKNNEMDYIPTDDTDEYAFIFSKNEKCDKYLNEFNEYINKIKLNGEYLELEKKWFRNNISDYTNINLNDTTGDEVIKVILSGDDVPFNYLNDNGEVIGYEVELIVNFAKEYGYKLDINVDEFNKIIDGVASNKYDIGMSALTITDERKKIVNFSNSILTGSVSYGILKNKNNDEEKNKVINKLEDLDGKTIGILSGSVYDDIAIKNINKCKLKYYDNAKELSDALNKNEIDGFIFDEPIAKKIVKEYSNFKTLREMIQYSEYGFIFTKDNSVNDKILEEINSYIEKLDSTNELELLEKKWFNKQDYKIDINYLELPNINGRINVCTNVDSVGEFSFINNGELVGYDIELLIMFCKEYGYALNIETKSFNEMINEVKNGKYMMGVGCINITEERKKYLNFSNPTYAGGIVVIVKNSK